MIYTFAVKNLNNAPARMLALTGAAFSLAHYSFGQTAEVDASTLTSGRAHASANNIPILFEGFGESTNDQGLREIRIRGKMARELYNKGAFLVILERDLSGSRFSYSGQGAVYIDNSLGKVESRPIHIASFRFDRVLVPYGEYMRNPDNGDYKIVWNYDRTLAGNDNSAARVKTELLNALCEAMQLPTTSAEPDGADLREHYYPRFKQLIKGELIGYFIDLQTFPSISQFQEETLTPEFKRYEDLLKADVPQFLKSTHARLKREYENCEWIRTGSISPYAAAAWKSINPDEKSVSEQGAASESVLFEAIKTGLDNEMRNLRRTGIQLKAALEVVAKQNEEYKVLIETLSAIQANPASDYSIKKRIIDSQRALERSAHDTPAEFKRGVVKFNAAVARMKVDLAPLEVAYKAKQAKIMEQKLIEAKLAREAEDRKRIWETIQNVAIGIFSTVVGVVVVVIGLLGGGVGSSAPLLTRPESDPWPKSDPYPDPYEPRWKREGRPDGQSSHSAD